jgi:hypothetical protein
MFTFVGNVGAEIIEIIEIIEINDDDATEERISLLFIDDNVQNLTTFSFTAWCLDCNEAVIRTEGEGIEVSGELVLTNFYWGESFNDVNFVSFSYFGPSNHVEAFTVLQNDNLRSVSGRFSEESYVLDLRFIMNGTSMNFTSGDLNTWNISRVPSGGGGTDPDAGIFDFGDNILFTQVPEPSPLSLMAIAIAGIMLRRSKR